jgi:tetratricopeptide (TPR) repeat protein
LRITGQLIEATVGSHIWADRFEGDLADVFDLQDQITSSVVGAIEPQIALAEAQRSQEKRRDVLAVYDLYLRAWAALRLHTEQGTDEALSLLLEALRSDPTYAAAYGLLAQSHLLRVNSSWGDAQVGRTEGTRAAHRAIETGWNDPVPLGLAGWAVSYLNSEHEAGLAAVERSLTLNSNGASAWAARGYIRVYLCETETAIGCFERASRLSPLDPELYRTATGIAFAHVVAQRFEAAAEAARHALQLNPRYPTATRILASACAHLGRVDAARQAVERLVELEPSLTVSTLIERSPRCGPAMQQYFDGLRLAGLPE